MFSESVQPSKSDDLQITLLLLIQKKEKFKISVKDN